MFGRPWASVSNNLLGRLARIFHHGEGSGAARGDDGARAVTTQGWVPLGRSGVRASAPSADARAVDPFCRKPKWIPVNRRVLA